MTTPMPAPGERRAPKFEGDDRTLVQFFKDYKTLAVAAGLTNLETIKQCVKYMTKEPRHYIEKLKEYRVTTEAEAKWDEFVARVKEDYPDADAPTVYSRADYDDFVRKAENKTFKTVEELVTFTRDFRCVSTDALEEGELSEAMVQREYYNVLLRALGQNFGVELRLKHKDKRPHQCTVSEILAVARVLLREAEAGGFLHGTDTKTTALPALSAPSTLQPAVKHEDDRIYTLLSNLNARFDGFDSRIGKLEKPRYSGGPPAQQTPATGSVPLTQGTGSPFNTTRCFYCNKDGHRVYECEHANEDIKKGLVLRTSTMPYRLYLPDGSSIRARDGGSLREGVLEWHKRNPKGNEKPGASASAMLVEIGDAFFAPEYKPSFSDGDAEGAWYQVMNARVTEPRTVEGEPRYPLRSRNPFQQGARKDGDCEQPPHLDRAKVDRIPPVPPVQSQPAARVRADQRATIEEIDDDDPPAPVRHATSTPAAPTIPPVMVPGAAVVRPSQGGPQYRIQAPIENDGLARILSNRILETKVTLTVEEILAISPSMRRHWSSATAGKRVTVGFAGVDEDGVVQAPGSAAAYFYREVDKHEDSRDLIAAPPALPLRYLDCRVSHGDHTFLVEGVIDDGSMMVLISKAFWIALGKPIDAERRLSLEAANNTKADTLGLCADLRVNVGGLDFYLQAHVVDDAPFSLLLGLPFIALTEMESKTRYDGSSVVTLHDLNTNRAVCIPTRARRAPRASAQPLDF